MKNVIFFLLILTYSCSNSQPQQNFAGDVSNSENNDDKNAEKDNQSSVNKNSRTPGKTINLVQYGAKGLGISSLKEDTAALHKAIAELNAAGGGKLYLPNPPKFYAFAGSGIYVGDNIEIYGDGKGKSEIRNVSPTSGKFRNGSIFMYSTYGPDDPNSIFQPGIDQYSIQDAQRGDQLVVLKDKSNSSKIFVGEVVVLGAGKFKHSDVDTKSRFYFMELNEITSISDGKITFKYPLSIQLRTFKQNDYPVIVNINNTKSMNTALNIVNHTSKNVSIHDMSFTQAQKDEVNNVPIDEARLRNGLSGVWQPGGAFEGKFRNLYMSVGGDLGGNMFTRSMFDNIEIHSPKKLVDFGYGSTNDTMQNINWVYLDEAASDYSASFIIINDASRNIVFNNINASGNWNGENLILLSGTTGIRANKLTFNFPNYAKNKSAIQIGDYEEMSSKDIILSNIHVTVNSIAQFLRITGKPLTNEAHRDIIINNCVFAGTVKVNSVNKNDMVKSNGKVSKNVDDPQGIFIKNADGIKLRNINISSGGLYLENSNNSEIDSIVAPASDLVVAGSSSNTTIANMKVRSKSVGVVPEKGNGAGGQKRKRKNF